MPVSIDEDGRERLVFIDGEVPLRALSGLEPVRYRAGVYRRAAARAA